MCNANTADQKCYEVLRFYLNSTLKVVTTKI